jgi:hypothetical protein
MAFDGLWNCFIDDADMDTAQPYSVPSHAEFIRVGCVQSVGSVSFGIS